MDGYQKSGQVASCTRINSTDMCSAARGVTILQESIEKRAYPSADILNAKPDAK